MKRMVVVAAMLVSFTVFATGCESIEGEKVSKIGTQIGETVSNFISGLGKGIKKETKADVVVEIAQDVLNQGLSKTNAKVEGKANEVKNLSVYFISNNNFQGELLAKALDEDGAEIGRAAVSVQFVKDDAKYIVFGFPKEMELPLVKKYSIELK